MKSIAAASITLLAAFLIDCGSAVGAEEPAPRRTDIVAGIAAAKGVSVAVWAANLEGPRGLLADRAGALWVAEENGGRVVKVEPGGKVTKLADGLMGPHDVEVDARGSVYVAETATGKVLQISSTGAISTFAEGLEGPVDLAFNRQGELVVCEVPGQRVVAFKSPREKRKLVSGFRPHGLAFDKSGSTYVNDLSGKRLVRVSPDGTIEQVAGSLDVTIGVAIGP